MVERGRGVLAYCGMMERYEYELTCRQYLLWAGRRITYRCKRELEASPPRNSGLAKASMITGDSGKVHEGVVDMMPVIYCFEQSCCFKPY